MSLDELLEAQLRGMAGSEHLAPYSEHLRGSSEHLRSEHKAHLLRLALPLRDRAKRLKQGMMQELLTGRIRLV